MADQRPPWWLDVLLAIAIAVPLSSAAFQYASLTSGQAAIAAGTCCGTAAATSSPIHGIDTRAIQDWLGHVSITHTTRYTQLSQTRFKDFWRD